MFSFSVPPLHELLDALVTKVGFARAAHADECQCLAGKGFQSAVPPDEPRQFTFEKIAV